MTGPALVVGGQGFFGRAVVDDLIEFSPVQVVVAGRRQRVALRHPRLSWKTMDLERPGSVAGFGVVVCAAGPFQGMSTALVEAAAREGVPYVDLSDDRDFIARARRIRSRAPVMTGLSVVPGLICLLAGRAAVGRVRSIRAIIAPGCRPQRGDATLSALLSGIEDWSGREIVQFPRPVGPRTVYRTQPFGDPALMSELFDGSSFEFKVGSDVDLMNRGLEAVSWLKRKRVIRDPRMIRSVLGAIVRTLSILGTDRGAARAEVTGDRGRYVGSVVARDRGHRIPSVLAAIAAARLLEGRLVESRLDRWLPDLDVELARRKLELIETRTP